VKIGKPVADTLTCDIGLRLLIEDISPKTWNGGLASLEFFESRKIQSEPSFTHLTHKRYQKREGTIRTGLDISFGNADFVTRGVFASRKNN
jgi:hypothetical protein